MNILITGASGFIGRHLMNSLNRTEHNVIACVRGKTQIQTRFPKVRIVSTDFRCMTRSEDWMPLLEDVDIVINCVGIINQTGSQTFDCLHSLAPIALFQAASEIGVQKIIQISALGCDDKASSKYHLSKKAADDALLAMDIPSAILRPSVVYGEGAASMAFFHALAALPVQVLIDQGQQMLQPVHIDDLVDLILYCISAPDQSQQFDVVGEKAVSMQELLSGLAQRLGVRRVLQFSVQSRFMIKMMGWLEKLRLPMLSRDNIRMLLRGNCASSEAVATVLGHQPVGVHEILFSIPASQAQRWHARLYFIRPLLRLCIAFVWLWSGITSVVFYPLEHSLDLLAMVGIIGFVAPLSLYGLSLLDVSVGLLTLVGWKPGLLLRFQLATVALYSVVLCVWLPEFLFHPFGPLLKNLPFLLAIYILLILEEERV